jgi:hypothetical protein
MEGREYGTIPGGMRLLCRTPGVWEFEPLVVCEPLGPAADQGLRVAAEPIPALLPGWSARRITLAWPQGEVPARVPAP